MLLRPCSRVQCAQEVRPKHTELSSPSIGRRWAGIGRHSTFGNAPVRERYDVLASERILIGRYAPKAMLSYSVHSKVHLKQTELSSPSNRTSNRRELVGVQHSAFASVMMC